MEVDMSIPVPERCANSECRDRNIEPIHRSSQPVASAVVDGPPSYHHHTTYRCAQCGHTWAVQGYSTLDNTWPAKNDGDPRSGTSTSRRTW
jgi:hypothetical protein